MIKYILLPFKGLITLMGVDFHQLNIILSAKLKMDNRRSLSLSQKGKNSSHQLLFQTFIYGFLGTLIGILVMSIKDPMVSYTFFFAYIMIMIAMLMISEFTNVLIDTRDNSILMSRPINSRTIVLAKILHIAFYMLHMSFSLSLFVIVATLINHGFVAMLALLILIVLAALFTLFLTNIFYLGLMNVVNGQKLKDIIVYFQVVMAIMFMGGYQLIPRMIGIYDITNIHIPIHWWSYFVPPLWMSASMDAYISSIYNTSHLIFFLCAVLVPILSLVFVVKVLAPRFNKALAQLDVASSKDKKVVKEKSENKGFISKLSRICTNNRVESTAFKMAWMMSGRERKFKQTVYPSFGYIFIFILIFAFKSEEAFDMENLANSNKYLWFIYTTIFISFSITQQLGYSDQDKSSWFYQILPIEKPGEILLGSFKSVMIKYFTPAFAVISAIALSIWGIQLIDDLIYGFLSVCLVSSLMQSWSDPILPFSKERVTQDAGGNFAKGMLLMISTAAIGFLHYGLSLLPYGVIIASPIVLLLLYFQLRRFRKISWDKIIN
ncbi:hypothetical protein [Marinifilum fragile]|uniref:hypothetical protein n=1 Tax=Marinifilum fragile TaxID=570161 RepID=UPI002AA788E5|nr:hypothetical protein [Marinifilum fragile]